MIHGVPKVSSCPTTCDTNSLLRYDMPPAVHRYIGAMTTPLPADAHAAAARPGLPFGDMSHVS
eukprot:8740112-Pyramimonas_sp.AAC.1